MKKVFALIAALALSACGTDKPAPQSLTPSTFSVDGSLKPSSPTQPGIDGGADRSVGTLKGAGGSQSDFVLNELLILTDDTAALQGFLSRWNGKVLRSFTPASVGLDGLKSYHLVQINPSSADPSKLAASVQKIKPNIRDDITVSSQEGLQLLAVAAVTIQGLD